MIDESELVKFYNDIANKMDEMIPCEWKRVVMYAEQIDGVTTYGFYFFTSDSNIYWCDEIPEEYGVDENNYDMQYFEIANVIRELWLEFKDAGDALWSTLTFDLDSDWKFKVKLGYDDIDYKIPALARRTRCFYDEFGIVPDSKNGIKFLKEYLEEQGRELPEELLG